MSDPFAPALRGLGRWPFALLAPLTIACRARGGVPRSTAADAARETTPLRAIRAPSVAATPFVIREESPLDAPPAAPPNCALDGVVRSVPLDPGPVSFATAAAGARALLALSSRDRAGVFISTGEGALLRPEPSFGPSTTLHATGAGDVFILLSRGSEDPAPPARLTLIARDRPPTAFALAPAGGLSFGDPLCAQRPSGVRCALAWGANEPERRSLTVASLTANDPIDPANFEFRHTLVDADPQSAVGADPPEWLVTLRGGPARVDAAGRAAAMPGAPLELARIDGALLALSARAPTSERCQPGAWALTLHPEPAPSDGGSPARLATLDARPTGARLRATGPSANVPLATWIDAPQCSGQLSVLRANRAGLTGTIARATAYDIAADHAGLSLAWRDGDRLRWARYRCPR